MFGRYSAWFFVVILLSQATHGAHLQGGIQQIGFPGSANNSSLQGVNRYRIGMWTPVLVELTNTGGDRFEGIIEAYQPDRDGDEILARREVSVQGVRQYFVYVPAGNRRNARPNQNISVRVYDNNNKGQFADLFDNRDTRIDELRPAFNIEELGPETYAVLDISGRPLTQLNGLLGEDKWSQPIAILRSSPRQVPDHTVGLEMINVIVWDAPEPGDMDLHQQNALIEWTRRGGMLVLGVSRTWEVISRSKFGELLPARLTGVTRMEEAPEWIMRVLGIGSQNLDRGRFVPPLSYCSVERSDMTDGASPFVFTSMVSGEEEDSSPAKEEFPVVRRPYGQGQVILVAMELNDLLRRGTGESQQQILADLLGLRLQRESKDGRSGGWMEVDLFDYLRQRTAFSVTAGLYLGFAFLFVVVYVTVATGGSWAWLKRKKILHHAWLAFAIVALFASGISVLAVQWIRGISYGLQEISVVDGRTASNEVVCRSYFGLKTPTHVQLDLLVPQDARQLEAVNDSPASLRPMSPSPQDSSGYEAFERYSALATVGELHRVPIRATLKQLESQWRGELPGRFFASLKWLRGGTNQLSEESWVENQLGTDLFDCYLFVTRQDVRVNRPYRDLFIRVYPLGILPAGKRVVNFEERLQSMVQSGAAGGEGKVILATRFEECCVGWLRQLGIRMDQPRYQQAEVQRVTVGQQEFVNAMLLMTLFSEIDRDRFQGTGCTVKSSEGEVLDRSLDLRGDNALFVGFSRERGPSRLCYRQAGATGRSWKILDPGKADVVYRMTVPIGEP